MELSKGTTFRLDPENRAGLEEFARRTRRSLNAALNTLLSSALADQPEGQRGSGSAATSATERGTA